MPNTLFYRVFLLTVMALFLPSCALSPQGIDIQPTPEVEYSAFGGNAPVAVQVRDERPEDHLGSRGGAYPDTSLLMVNNDLPKEIYDAVTKGLHQQGFNVLNPGNKARRLTLYVDELRYTPAEGTVVNGVTVDVRLRAEVQEGSQLIYRNRYHSETEHKMPFTPSTGKNQTLINQELTRTLERLLKDEKLLSALKDGKS